ncbi:serpentine type 7TM GPCR chemoreceptor srd domain-containing protein [Ditylenchus destructor]|uniref:Serpentine type 7TM GPCR chemoreceptor srd domain-containing protein n=1 Tax=Ditylenchus destructor TaxID=166010 RepID=A0AAD4MQ76_9BILA|nr:serpentine type 7TM GPCR chemoreceptor srd domain-containing protein [Ditylenchus destructor]
MNHVNSRLACHCLSGLLRNKTRSCVFICDESSNYQECRPPEAAFSFINGVFQNATMNISRIHHSMESIIGMLSLTANLTLLYLIITKSQFRVKAYNKALLVTCLVDLFYTVVVFVGQPTILADHGYHYCQVNGFFPIDGNCSIISVADYIALPFTLTAYVS